MPFETILCDNAIKGAYIFVFLSNIGLAEGAKAVYDVVNVLHIQRAAN